MMDWNGKNVLITGGAGFIGSYLVEEMLSVGANVRVADNFARGRSKNLAHIEDQVDIRDCNLLDASEAATVCSGQDVVFNLVSKVAGAEYSNANHAELLDVNFRLASVVTHAARFSGVERFLVVSSACVYPKEATIPTPEEEGFDGEPEAVNAGYGWAKRMSERLGEMHAEESGMQVGIVRPFNAYGPRDRFDEGASYVVPSLIRRISAGEDPLTVWGSGQQTRTFLYAADLATGMRLVAETGMSAGAINIASQTETTIEELVREVATACGKHPTVMFDESKPEGHKRRAADVAKLRRLTGWVPETRLSEGLSRTVNYYLSEFRAS